MVSLFLAQGYRSAKASLTKVQAFSDNLVENMPIGLLVIDQEGTITATNKAAEAMLNGASPAPLKGQPAGVLPRPLAAVVDDLKAGGVTTEKDIHCPLGDNRAIPLEVVATLLRDENGTLLGAMLLLRDLTQMQRLKEEVARSQRLAAIGSLAAGVAHEIRNPLSSIKGFATYFKDRYRDAPEDQKTAEIMIQEVDRLNRVIGQLLEFARPMTIEKRRVSLNPLIRHSLRLIEGDLLRKGIRIRQGPLCDPDEISLDPDRFQQVLLNLYLNAIEAMDDGGTLAVDCRKEDRGWIRVTVSDSGRGIREEDLSRIFDPYFTSKSSGTGLGLAIVHKIVESHGGEVLVRSAPGEGTEMTVRMPASKEA
jgi:two-component system sensor histidine kinase HydH